MTVREALLEGRNTLSSNESPYLEALLLLAKVLKTTKEKLLAMGPDELTTYEQEQFHSFIKSREQGEPIAYILGYREFYGLKLHVDHRVLDPRPDTEILVEASLELMQDKGNFLDLCTGSGCVALAIKDNKPQWDVHACDLSTEALDVAKMNSQNLNIEVQFHHSDLLSDVPGKYNLIATNPPYLSPQETQDRIKAGWVEPAMALDGFGSDGLELIRKIIPQAIATLHSKGYLLIEAAPWQMVEIAKLFHEVGYINIQQWKDLSGQVRVTGGMRP
ncbi:peptide chain release factor N(5)-glutamine methyltransferase [Spirochaeta cellobiosiphila]|uniref:peptide chain release factor N(5)-glutamine methyltransferase n=1 Tax=Spirochaeta cellobiosiphila TaxID=504483 RepID=UPI00040533C4|nr:peptide chain release factor N(5)-glutamine methyltransferase [Spirochaeta cellobiosiphila]